MQLEFRFYIDGSEIDAPDNWESFKMILQRDPDLRGVLRSFSNAMTVTRTDFATLYAKIENHLFDTPLTFRVDYSTNNGSTYSEFMSAYIFIDDISFDLIRRTAEFTLTDISYSAKIEQNQDLVFSTAMNVSKNGVSITQLQNAANVLGYSTALNRSLYLWPQMIQYVVDYITDGSVIVDDNWHESLNDYSGTDDEYIAFVAWYSFIYGNYTRHFKVSFKRIYISIARLYNLWYCITESSGTSYFTIDTESNHFSSTSAFTLNSFKSLSIRLSTDYIYTSVKVGDPLFNRDLGVTSSNYTDLRIYNKASFVEPYTFFINGESAIEGKELDLTTEISYSEFAGNYASSTSIPDKSMPYIRQYHDTGSGLSESGGSLDYEFTRYGISGSYINTGDVAPRSSLMHSSILARYNFLEDINLRNNGDYNAQVFLGADQNVQGTVDIVEWDRSSSGSVDTLRCFTSDGYYQFLGTSNDVYNYQIDLDFDLENTSGSNNNTISIGIRMYDLYGNQYPNEFNDIEVINKSLSPSQLSTGNTYSTTICVNDSAARIAIEAVCTGTVYGSGVDIKSTSNITITPLDDVGRTIRSANSSSVKAYEVDIDSFCTISDFLTIWQDPRKRIALNLYDENTKYAWVKDLEYTPATGQLEGTLMTDDTNLNT